MPTKVLNHSHGVHGSVLPAHVHEVDNPDMARVREYDGEK